MAQLMEVNEPPDPGDVRLLGADTSSPHPELAAQPIEQSRAAGARGRNTVNPAGVNMMVAHGLLPKRDVANRVTDARASIPTGTELKRGSWQSSFEASYPRLHLDLAAKGRPP
jgi:hypothetical protein